MSRLRRFIANAGIRGGLLSLLVAIVVVFAVRADVETGCWVTTVPVLVGAVVLAYLLRDVLVDHLAAARAVMNALVVLLLIVSAARRWLPSEALWFRIALAAFIGAYLGSYFWLMSDERIVVQG